jgi:hypothetical protein
LVGRHDESTGQFAVDELALEFAETALRKQINGIDDLAAVKEIAVSLLAVNYRQRLMLDELMMENLRQYQKPE